MSSSRTGVYQVPTRRHTVGCLAAVVCAWPLAALWAAGESTPSKATELLRDPSFRGGFVLLRPEPGRKQECGTVNGLAPGAAVWQLAQWSSRHPFDRATAVEHLAGGALRLVNPARSVTFGGSDGVLALTINAAEEYGTHPRAANDPWVHLLVEQPLVAAPKLGDLTALRLHLEARRLHARLTSDAGHDPRIHAAQFQIFITVQDLNKESPGYGNYLWFGIPIFDNRKRVVSTYSAADFGGTGKFIHTPGSEHFTRGSTHDEGWVTFDAELLPLISEGMVAARSKGFLKELDDALSFRVTAFNMGWEVPGTFDVGMQVRKLSLVFLTRLPQT